MTNDDQQLGRKGGQIITSAAAITNANFYYIYVAEAAVLTVCKEKDFEHETSTDVMTEQNLTGITIPAGVCLVPRKNMFSDITVTSGKLYGYKGS
jgi:hypothetical protein